MFKDNMIVLGTTGEFEVGIYPKMANRHGLIAGATGTGKTTTLKTMAESFSEAGVPVFLADIKGDISFDNNIYPVSLWDIYGRKGLPLRTTISEMGPLLLSRVLDLNDTQSDILTIIFKIADDQGLLLLDTKDLKSMIQYVGENLNDYVSTYGNMTKQSLNAMVRAVVALEAQGGEDFFGEPALSIGDWLCTGIDGKGSISILNCQELINSPKMYSTFMLWLLSELYEGLPEVGDLPKPKMVFFFDEAHLLFDSANKVLLQKIEQVVKLIRSKGVGIYFITQSPKDIPDGVLAQLGNKIQHALHAYTPAEQKAVKAASLSLRANDAFDTYEALTTLGVGEALVSVLDMNGVPTVVEKAKIYLNTSKTPAMDDSVRGMIMKSSLLYTKYSQTYDRESAYEILMKVAQDNAEAAAREAEELAAQKAAEKEAIAAQKQAEKEAAAAQRAEERANLAAQKANERAALAEQKAKEKADAAKKNTVKKAAGNVAKSAAGTVGREIGNAVGQSIGGSFGKKLGGNVGASLGRGLLSTLFK